MGEKNLASFIVNGGNIKQEQGEIEKNTIFIQLNLSCRRLLGGTFVNNK